LFLLSFGIVGGCSDTTIILDDEETFPDEGGGGGGGDSGNPGVCQMPPLTNNFSNEIYFFLDSDTGFVVGVSSTGRIVSITITAPPGSFGTKSYRANTLGEDSEDFCDIFREIFADGDQGADGSCSRQSNGSRFVVFVDNNNPLFFNITGDCFTVVSPVSPVGTSDIQLEADRIFNDMVDAGALDPSYNPIPLIIEELIQ